jgi:hypothetical protein
MQRPRLRSCISISIRFDLDANGSTLPLAISAPCAGPPHPATVAVKSKRAAKASPYGVPKELATTVATSRQLSTEQMRKVKHHMWEIQSLLCFTSAAAAAAHTSFHTDDSHVALCVANLSCQQQHVLCCVLSLNILYCLLARYKSFL